MGSGDRTERYELAELVRDKTPWTLSVHPDQWVFESAGVTAQVITRDKLRSQVDVETLSNFRVLNVTLDRKRSFRLTTEQRAALLAWIGPPTREDLAAALDRHHGIQSLAIGAVLVLVSTPWVMPGC